jgi:hypothetical protein
MEPANPAPARPQPRAPVGNQALLRRLQPKLTVGAIDDPLEAEADTVADRVMRMEDPTGGLTQAPPAVSRKCAACEEDDKKLQSKPAGIPARGGDGASDRAEAPSLVDEALRGPGEKLDTGLRAFFEPRFGADFSDVRVHHGETAEKSAQAVGARAYTVGSDIVFAAGSFAPGSDDGRRLIAHELAHVRQQAGSGGAFVRREGPPAPTAPPAPAGGAPAPAAAGAPCPPTAIVVAKSLSEYVDLMKCAEAQLGMPPRDMLTMFRQLYYGSQSWSVSSFPVWDDVVKCPQPVGDPRPKLGKPLLDSLQASQEVAGVDVGHVFVGLESMLCPTADVTVSKTVAGIHPSVNMTNEDFATWGGDLGAAVAAWAACPSLGAASTTRDDCFRLPATASITDFLKASAPDQDLQGDIDAYALRAAGLGVPCGGTALKTAALPPGRLSGVFQDYYNNAGSGLGKAHTNNVRCFVEFLGATLDPSGKYITNRDAIVAQYQDKVADFALAFAYKITGSKSAAFGRFVANAAGAGPMFNYSGTAVRWFLNWLEARL